MARQTPLTPLPVPPPDHDARHRPVVVGVDGSAGSDRALRRAASEAIVRRVPLVVAHVWSIPAVVLTAPLGAAAADPTPFADAAQRIGDAAVDLVRREFGDRLADVELCVSDGYPADRLVEIAEHAALLVVGSRGRGGFASLMLGSVADGCAHRAHCPVMVVRPDAPPAADGDVVVGIDDTRHGRAALRWAAREAGRLQRRLVVVHAHDVHDVLYPEVAAELGDLPPGIERNFTATGRRFVDRLIGPIAEEGHKPVSVSWRLVQQAAPRALVEAAEHASLLVVGASDRLGLHDRLIGSVSRQCLHHAPCPVVVVHEDPAAEGLQCAS